MELLNFIKENLGEHKIKGKEILVKKCPYCNNEKWKLSINTEKNVFQCFSGSCREAGHLSKLYAKFNKEYSGEKTNQKREHIAEFINPTTEKIYEWFEKERKISRKTIKNNLFDIMSTKTGAISFVYRKKFDINLIKVRYFPDKKFSTHKIKDLTLWKLDFCDIDYPLIICEGECFPGNVEVFTSEGWKRFDSLTKKEKILQVDDNMNGDFVNPIQYIEKDYNDELICLRNGRNNYKSITTKNHNIVYKNKEGKIVKKTASDVANGIIGNIPTSIKINAKGIDLKNEEIALYIAIAADATYRRTTKDGYGYYYCALKKERKIKRLEEILNKTNTRYTKILQKDGYTTFNIWSKKAGKLFPKEWLTEMSLEQRKYFIEEMVYWDGNFVPNRNQYEFSSKHYEENKFVQTIAHTCGYMSTIMKRKNSFGEWYKTSILLNKDSVSWQLKNKHKFEKHNGKVYCVTVPTGMILTRTEGSISVTGNCDQLSFEEQGIENSVSVPSGCNSMAWIDTDFEELEKFKTIILAFDNDKAGEGATQKALNEIMKRMPEDCEIKILDYGKYKDANEVHKADIDLRDFINNAVEIDDDYFIKFSDIDINEQDIKFSTGSLTFNRAIGGIRMGELSIWTGCPGSGKSTVLNQVMLNIAEQGGKCLIYSPELTNKQYKKWTCRQLLGDDKKVFNKYFCNVLQRDEFIIKNEIASNMSKWIDDNIKIVNANISLSSKEALRIIVKQIKKINCNFIIIDNLMKLIFEEEREITSEQKDFINKLSEISKKYNVSINLVAHPKKHDKDNPDQYDIMGSSNIPNLVDNIYYFRRITDKCLNTIYWKSKKSFYEENKISTVMINLKSREGEKIGYWYEFQFDLVRKSINHFNEEPKYLQKWKEKRVNCFEGVEVDDIPDMFKDVL